MSHSRKTEAPAFGTNSIVEQVAAIDANLNGSVLPLRATRILAAWDTWFTKPRQGTISRDHNCAGICKFCRQPRESEQPVYVAFVNPNGPRSCVVAGIKECIQSVRQSYGCCGTVTRHLPFANEKSWHVWSPAC